jgi:acyl carrier protein
MDNAIAAEPIASTSCESTRWKQAVSELADARLRQLVAERLGLNALQLRADASLTDDLGADATDLLEIAVALEEEFGLQVSDAVLGSVRTYGDLAASVASLLRSLAESDAAELPASGIVRVRVIRNRPDHHGTVLRATRLTRRVIESLVEEELWPGGVARLEVACAGNTTDGQLAALAQRLAWLRTRGVQVSVQRIGQETALAVPGRSDGDTLSRAADACGGKQTHAPAAAHGIGIAE